MEKIQMQILDCDYSMLNGKPLIRIFGKTLDGRPVCIFINGFLPYFYLLPQQPIEKIKNEMRTRYDVSFEECERFLPIGYGPAKKVLKIIGKDPAKIPEIKEFSKRYGTPYEADVLFKYRYMIDHGLKGMCWVEAEGKYVFTKTVKCKAFEAEKIFSIEKAENIPLKYMSLDIECVTEDEKRLPQPEKDSIIIISLCFFPDYKGKKKLTLIAKRVPIDRNNEILCFDNEKEMLKRFSEILQEFDPDIIVGYNINNYDLPYIVKRLEILQMPRDLGRAEKHVYLKKLQAGIAPSIVGRIVVDPYEILKRDPWVKFKRYDLGTVAKALLNAEKIEINGIREMREMWNGGDIKKFMDYSQRDSELALKLIIEKTLLDKFFELAKVSGLLLQDSLGGQSQRHECKLLHEFFKRKILMPCKPEALELKKYKKERETKGLKGALVLEPKVGLHEYVLVLDFASLYPSIIRTYNICPTTLLLEGNAESITTPSGAKFVAKGIREGVLPAVLKELIEVRKAVKAQMKKEHGDARRDLNAKQLALKDMSNSVHPETDIVVKDNLGRIKIVEIGKLFEELERQRTVKKISEDIEAIELSGWHTLSVEGNKACFKPLYAITRHKNKENLIKIRTKMGEVRITKDHSIIKMTGKASNRIRNSRFTGLDAIEGGKVNKDTIIAQVKSFDMDENHNNKYLNLIEILLSLPEEEIKDIYLFVPKSMGLNKHNWFRNRVKVFEYLKKNGRSNSVEVCKSLGFERRVLRTTDCGMERVGLTTVGNCGTVPVYDITEEGEKYIDFYKAFLNAREAANFYEIPLRKLKNIRIPSYVLNNSKIAVGGRMGAGRRKIDPKIPISNEFAEIFGWFVSEGSTYKHRNKRGTWFVVRITNYDKNVLRRLKFLIKKVFDYDAVVRNDHIQINSKTLYLIFRQLCGTGSYTKKVPEFIINSTKEIRNAFLEAYTKGDGNKNGKRLNTVSKHLMAQLNFLLKEQDCIQHNGKDSGIFRISKRKSVQGKKIVSGDLFGQPPVEIEEVGQSEYVYDLSVEDTEKFVTAQGLVLHNSLYGYTGYIRARLYVMAVANSITAYGRENIVKTKKMIEDSFPVEVLYSDTDSVFLKSNIHDLEDAWKLGEKIAESVSKKLSGYLSLEFEKIYKTFLILTKKRYAGWRFEKADGSWTDKIEMRGIETVRRDWCLLTTETMLHALDIILKEGDVAKAAKYVRSVVEDLAAGRIPLEKLTIVKGLTKTPESYDGVQPHAELAKKISMRDPTRAPMVGERLGYVIVKGNQLISKRAEDPDFVREKGLEIDPQYYIENQLLPPLERVFEVCGIGKAEIIEGSKQKKLFELIRHDTKPPELTVLKGFESVSCKKCSWSFRRPPIAGACPKCGGQLFFQKDGSIGAFVETCA